VRGRLAKLSAGIIKSIATLRSQPTGLFPADARLDCLAMGRSVRPARFNEFSTLIARCKP